MGFCEADAVFGLAAWNLERERVFGEGHPWKGMTAEQTCQSLTEPDMALCKQTALQRTPEWRGDGQALAPLLQLTRGLGGHLRKS